MLPDTVLGYYNAAGLKLRNTILICCLFMKHINRIQKRRWCLLVNYVSPAAVVFRCCWSWCECDASAQVSSLLVLVIALLTRGHRCEPRTSPAPSKQEQIRYFFAGKCQFCFAGKWMVSLQPEFTWWWHYSPDCDQDLRSYLSCRSDMLCGNSSWSCLTGRRTRQGWWRSWSTGDSQRPG